MRLWPVPGARAVEARPWARSWTEASQRATHPHAATPHPPVAVPRPCPDSGADGAERASSPTLGAAQPARSYRACHLVHAVPSTAIPSRRPAMDWDDMERRCHSVSPGIVAKARRGMWASAVLDLDEAGDALRPFVFLRAALEMDSDSWTEVRPPPDAAAAPLRRGPDSAGHPAAALALPAAAAATAAPPLHLQWRGAQNGAGPAQRGVSGAGTVPARVDGEPRGYVPSPCPPPAPLRVWVA